MLAPMLGLVLRLTLCACAAIAIGASLVAGSPMAWILALAVQAPGLVAERWFFFAQARHPQNLYYQVVS